MAKPWDVEEHPERSNEPVLLPAAIRPTETPPVTAPAPQPLDCPRRVIRELVRLQGGHQPGCSGFRGPGHVQEAALLKRLAAAKPELLLAGGPEEANRIFEYAPPLLAPFVLGSPAKTLEQAVRLIALNLDWYLIPPRPLIRGEWFWQLLALGLLAWGTVGVIALVSGNFSTPFLGSSMLCAFLAWPLWLGCHGDPRRAFWIRTLLKHLRGVYNLPEGGGPAVDSDPGAAGAPAEPLR